MTDFVIQLLSLRELGKGQQDARRPLIDHLGAALRMLDPASRCRIIVIHRSRSFIRLRTRLSAPLSPRTSLDRKKTRNAVDAGWIRRGGNEV